MRSPWLPLLLTLTLLASCFIAAPSGFRINPYREMLDTVQRDADQFAGGDGDRLGNLWEYFSSFWFFQRLGEG